MSWRDGCQEAWALLWQPLLAAGHQLIAYDLRGHGRSTLGWSGFGVHAYAQDLAAVLDHFDVRQGVVVAHSTGGIGALALAAWSSADGRAGQAGQDQQGRQGVAASRPCPDAAGTATAGPSPRAREIVAPIPPGGGA